MVRRAFGIVLVLLAVLPVSTRERLRQEPAESQARTLTFEERVAAQHAIEEVYWRHRIWPKDNPQPKPPLEVVMPESAIRAKVEAYLRKSNALEVYWSRPITAEQLQAEMERMARDSKAAGLLHDFFAALGDDPFLIAECVARPVLANRLVRNWYARDARFHGDLRREVETSVTRYGSVGKMKSMAGRYEEVTWVLRTEGETPERETNVAPAMVSVDEDEWHALVQRMQGAEEVWSLSTSPARGLRGVVEDDASFSVLAILDQGPGYVKTATVTWPKKPFDAWWDENRATLAVEVSACSDPSLTPYRLVSPTSGCLEDTWAPTRFGVPDSRAGHTAVWTGVEMIVWGGYQSPLTQVRIGGRYDPATDTWAPISMGPNLPGGNHTAVWTGTEMIVWGGSNATQYFNAGGRYDPATDIWAPTSTFPSARSGHRAVWTGTEMIVWGGTEGGHYVNTGGRYRPATDTWVPISTAAPAPSPRYTHSMVWTGTQLIVWGGYDGTSTLNTGGRYDPTADTWVATATGANVPTRRFAQRSVWTGTEMIIWGGFNNIEGYLNTGGRYNPSSNTWRSTSTGPNVPNRREGESAVWTGSDDSVGRQREQSGRSLQPGQRHLGNHEHRRQRSGGPCGGHDGSLDRPRDDHMGWFLGRRRPSEHGRPLRPFDRLMGSDEHRG